jgi:4-aminobutyrate aminotransferase
VAMRILRERCSEHGILFVSDEVQAGFGRCGSMFACERYEIEPDMVAMAKSLAGGLVLSAVTSRAEIMDSPGVGGIGGTYGGNPIACAAANAVLDIMQDEKLPQRAVEIGRKTMAVLEELEKTYPFLVNARGLGAMCAIEVVDPNSGRPDMERVARFVGAARDQGLLLMTASGNVIRTLMPLTIPDADLEKAFGILRKVAGVV